MRSLAAFVPIALLAPSLTYASPGQTKSVIAQMFGWSWTSVGQECTNFLGPNGYGYVQVSPPAEHIQGSQWYTDYQPVSYTLTSKRGNRAQFASMISTCHAAGVKVIVDTILNHMAGIDSGTGIGGSSFTHYSYPGIYTSSDFHYCGLTSNNDIADYTNRAQVQTCELVNLSDIATDREYPRSRLAQYIQDLLSLGADGLRLDAAKHIAAADISNILSRVNGSPYITQEVFYGAGEVVLPSEYASIGDVQEFRYTYTVKAAFESGGISSLQNFDNRGWVSSNVANVFVDNHDVERNGVGLSYKSGALYTLAMAFTLAHPYGTPTITSSFEFSDNNAGAPNGGAGTCSAAGGANGWICQHRWTPVVGLVGFRNAVFGTALNNWITGNSQQIAFGRGSAGFIAINNADSAWTATFTTPLSDGTYCNVYAGTLSGSSCTGGSFTVSGGRFTATIAGRTAVAIHVGAKSGGSTSPSTVTVTFSEYATTNWGENIFVVGSIPALGSWSPTSSVALSSASYPTWVGSVTIPANTAFTYKYIKRNGDTVIWESDPNRSFTTGTSNASINDTWR